MLKKKKKGNEKWVPGNRSPWNVLTQDKESQGKNSFTLVTKLVSWVPHRPNRSRQFNQREKFLWVADKL